MAINRSFAGVNTRLPGGCNYRINWKVESPDKIEEMWPYKPKTPPKQTEKPKYDVGDRVRIWKVLKNPTGRVQDVIEEKGVTKFNVSYEYHDGRYFTEVFEGTDLTLVEKYSKSNCNCGSNSSRHSDWCNKIVHPNGW